MKKTLSDYIEEVTEIFDRVNSDFSADSVNHFLKCVQELIDDCEV